MNCFDYESKIKIKKKNIFFWGGEGGGKEGRDSRVSEYFFKESN